MRRDDVDEEISESIATYARNAGSIPRGAAHTYSEREIASAEARAERPERSARPATVDGIPFDEFIALNIPLAIDRVTRLSAGYADGHHLHARVPAVGETLDGNRVDLEAVAVEALAEAARRWNPDWGAAFSTYAVPWIDGAIKKAFTADRRYADAVRVARHVVKQEELHAGD